MISDDGNHPLFTLVTISTASCIRICVLNTRFSVYQRDKIKKAEEMVVYAELHVHGNPSLFSGEGGADLCLTYSGEYSGVARGRGINRGIV